MIKDVAAKEIASFKNESCDQHIFRRWRGVAGGMLVGFAGRLVALPTVVIMLVAIYLTGVSEGNTMVLIGCVGVMLLGTGPLSLWNPEPKRLWRVLRRQPKYPPGRSA